VLRISSGRCVLHISSRAKRGAGSSRPPVTPFPVHWNVLVMHMTPVTPEERALAPSHSNIPLRAEMIAQYRTLVSVLLALAFFSVSSFAFGTMGLIQVLSHRVVLPCGEHPVQSYCKTELDELCSDAKDATSIVQCLVISSEKVSPSCLRMLTTVATDSKCAEDVVRFCAKASNVARCLEQNAKRLSPECRDEVEQQVCALRHLERQDPKPALHAGCPCCGGENRPCAASAALGRLCDS
jgi:hypothetical protein